MYCNVFQCVIYIYRYCGSELKGKLLVANEELVIVIAADIRQGEQLVGKGFLANVSFKRA